MTPNFKLSITLLTVVIITGCTFVSYKDDTRSMTVIDTHPGGETLDLEAALTGKGTLSVNRDKGSIDSTVDAIGEAVDRNIGL